MESDAAATAGMPTAMRALIDGLYDLSRSMQT